MVRMCMVIAASLVVIVTALPLGLAQAQNQERCFPETGFCISGRIRTFWEQNGGLPVFGFPIGPLQDEYIEGRTIQAQWFERNRLELHPDNPARDVVLLGRLGADRLTQQGRDWQSFEKAAAQDGCRFFPETGHNVCGDMLAYWQANGLNRDGQAGVSADESLALFGLPLSGLLTETLSDGNQYSVQYFERARFELHPELPAPNTVLLGLLSRELRPFSSSLVDRTQDYEGVGFPDQRKIARDSQGNLYIAYRKKVDDVYRIFVARSGSGGAWSVLNANQPIENIGPYQQRNPAIAIDASDTIHVVWYGQDADHAEENHRQIKYARSTDRGATWSPWRNIADVPGYSDEERWQEHPSLYVYGATITVVWEGFDQSSQREEQVKLVQSTDGGQSWTGWQNVSPEPDRSHSRPTVVANNDGSRLYILAYGERGKDKQIIWTTSADKGATWSPWQPIAVSSTEQSDVSLAMDSTGRLHAVWQQRQAGGRWQIVYASSDGNGWSAPAVIASSQAASQFFPSIAVTSQDRLVTVWTESHGIGENGAIDPKLGNIMISTQLPGQAWTAPVVLNPYGSTAIYGSLRWSSIAPGGNVDVVWMDTSDLQNRRIRHTVFGAW